jgi:hypothetical protein
MRPWYHNFLGITRPERRLVFAEANGHGRDARAGQAADGAEAGQVRAEDHATIALNPGRCHARLTAKGNKCMTSRVPYPRWNESVSG